MTDVLLGILHFLVSVVVMFAWGVCLGVGIKVGWDAMTEHKLRQEGDNL